MQKDDEKDQNNNILGGDRKSEIEKAIDKANKDGCQRDLLSLLQPQNGLEIPLSKNFLVYFNNFNIKSEVNGWMEQKWRTAELLAVGLV